jgi:hypothetical protein
MSLWLFRGAIARAVAGELSPGREARLRRHLSTCEACRQHYDAASLVAGGAARERARLLHALGLPTKAGAGSAQQPAKEGPRHAATARRWALALVPALAVVVLLARRSPPVDEVTERGRAETPAAEEARASLVLRFYARRPGAAVRLVGEMPGSGELRVGRDEQVQLAYVGLRAPRTLVLVARDQSGRATQLPSGALAPSSEPRLVGTPFSPAALGAQLQLTATVARGPADEAPAVLTASLWVAP